MNSLISYRLVISYNGFEYSGWQIQNSEKTVQGELNRALRVLCKSEDIKSLAAGRTDAGVHALAQVVRIDIPLEIEEKNLLKALNSNLPNSIEVKEVQRLSEHFHPIGESRGKQYQYIFTNLDRALPLSNGLIANYRFPLSMDAMQQATALFLGEHNFHNFECSGSEVLTTIKNITKCEITQRSDTETPFSFGNYYCVTIEGNGFLKQMVRLMVGAIWEIGRGKSSLEDLRNALSQDIPKRVGPVAPSEGLYMAKVFY